MKQNQVIMDENNNKIVVIADILFMNKQNIDWKQIENYLKKYTGEVIRIEETNETVYLGNVFPDEYAGSKYTRMLKGARAKAKANAVQAIREMIEIASEKVCKENYKKKHHRNAASGWCYYTTRFALPIYSKGAKSEEYNVYRGNLVMNCPFSGKMYLYDLVNIKKEASNPLKINE